MKSKLNSAAYGAAIAAARKSGGKEVQSHWEARLKTAVKRPAKPAETAVQRLVARDVGDSQGSSARPPRGRAAAAPSRARKSPGV